MDNNPLVELDLRDRWGYELESDKLNRISRFVVQNSDQEEGELVDSLALAMLSHDVPMACSGQDTPPTDELLIEIIRTVKERHE